MNAQRDGIESRRYKRNGVALIVSYLAALLMVATLAALDDTPGQEATDSTTAVIAATR